MNAAFFTDLYDRIDAFVDDWVDVTFAAGNFTANGSMTWTLASGDQLAFRYRISNKSMLVVFGLSATTVGGTPSTILKITIPDSKVATVQMSNTFWFQDNGTAGIGLAQVDASGTTINLYRPDLSNWAASTNATAAAGQIEFQIN